MPDVQPVKALYYPRAQFASIGWVKAALLYWESLLRVVPDGLDTHDPPEVHDLVAAGLIEDISPTPYRDATKTAFAPRLEAQLRARGGPSPCLRPEADEPSRGEANALVHIAEIAPEL